MKLTSKTSYFIGYDFKTETTGRKGSKFLQNYIDSKPELEWKEDLRLPCISLVSNNNVIEHIKQYTIYYGLLMQNNPIIMNYLDFGYIPVAFYPTCYATENELFDRQLEELGVTVHKFQAIYAGDVRYRDVHTDSWVSRFDISKILDIPPDKIKTTDILRGLFQNELA